ncbi:MAG: glycosyltransferase [Bacteroidetes bacterium]|nr:MAG: glycosyltransferase [Bacteroidota bacterium]MBL1145384.1 glycosyltransferase [Bacteroidota bacterium]NOG58182.1 glycosyltransferase [Bacteroidota bacterium]
MSKIKIGYVVNDLTVGGVSQVVISLCNSLDYLKYEIHLLILSDSLTMLNNIPLNNNVTLHLFNYKFETSYTLFTYLKNSFFLRKTFKKSIEIREKIIELNLNILHFHTLPRQLAIGILAYKKQPNIKLIFTDHSARITQGDYKIYQRALLSLAYKRLYKYYNLIAVSNVVSNYILKYKLNNKKLILKTLENSINIKDYVRTSEIVKEKLNCIYISRINYSKGHITLIEAWKKLNHPLKGKLFIIGPDETNGKIETYAKMDESIVFTGSVSNVRDFLNISSIGIFPSSKEGLPISLLEKMAYKLPVITSDIPELKEIINNNIEGLNFKLNDVDSLLEKVLHLFNNTSKIIEMGNFSREKVELICNLNNPIEFHNNIYNLVLQQ